MKNEERYQKLRDEAEECCIQIFKKMCLPEIVKSPAVVKSAFNIGKKLHLENKKQEDKKECKMCVLRYLNCENCHYEEE